MDFFSPWLFNERAKLKAEFIATKVYSGINKKNHRELDFYLNRLDLRYDVQI